MSEPINDGGPAFPVLNCAYNSVTKKWEPIGPVGIPLRDWLAGQELPALITATVQSAKDSPDVTYMDTLRESVIKAFKVADMAIEVREKGDA